MLLVVVIVRLQNNEIKSKRHIIDQVNKWSQLFTFMKITQGVLKDS